MSSQVIVEKFSFSINRPNFITNLTKNYKIMHFKKLLQTTCDQRKQTSDSTEKHHKLDLNLKNINNSINKRFVNRCETTRKKRRSIFFALGLDAIVSAIKIIE